MKLLCKLGLHRWSYFSQAASFYAAFPRNLVSRRCTHCRTMQCTSDGRTWVQRL